MTQPLSIMHIMAPGPAGGLETVVRLLAGGHARAGHRVHLAAVLDGDAALAEAPVLGAAGVEVHRLALPERAYLRERREIAELCRRVRPAVVHTHGYRPDVVDAGVARRLGCATVTTVHGFTGGGWRNRLYERLQRAAFRRFDAVVAVSRPLAHELERAGIAPPRLRVVPNAYAGGQTPPLARAEARHRLGIADDLLRVGWVGRLSAEKGPDLLVRAVAELRDLPVAVSVVGDGGERSDVVRLARDLGVADRITWHGTIPDAASLYAAFDVFALSSRTEGTPMSLFEAMAAGVPVIATRVGGVPDVVGPAEALLVAPGDARALAGAIRQTFADRGAAAARAAAARRRLADEFCLEPWLARYEAIYRDVQRAS